MNGMIRFLLLFRRPSLKLEGKLNTLGERQLSGADEQLWRELGTDYDGLIVTALHWSGVMVAETFDLGTALPEPVPGYDISTSLARCWKVGGQSQRNSNHVKDRLQHKLFRRRNGSRCCHWPSQLSRKQCHCFLE